ncbi:hypothetical protein B0T20DRAFT_360824 [Sordaria brevicollis]|uniref:VWFA domain-containing protein n=1 Tax=Sordaria brevicollis TaxID=83679 RepID=A0AAE0U643_SORBR|nr:hypothetical protein B0T20DRAFT_360824 [Sordaria brevicollis]
MSDPTKKKDGGFARGLKSLFGTSKKKSDPYQSQQHISTAHDVLASNNPFASSSEAAPPSYTEAMSGKPGASSSIPRRVTLDGQLITGDDDQYAFLGVFDTVFLIDDSGSMRGERWAEARDALAAIAPVCVAHDKDGIDIHFINHSNPLTQDPTGKIKGDVIAIFERVQPTHLTNTGQRIRDILDPYLAHYTRDYKNKKDWDPERTGVKPINLIVITDGVATDNLEYHLKKIIERLDKVDAPHHQVGIQFFQVGNDKDAADMLADLDDEFTDRHGNKTRDIIDTVTWDPESKKLEGDKLLKVVLGSVVKRLDRRK